MLEKPDCSDGPEDRPMLFENITADRAGRDQWKTLSFSALGHVLVVGLAIVAPLFWVSSPPLHTDYIRALIYDPPPPPPPPLPRGSAMIPKKEPAKPVTPRTDPEALIVQPTERPKEEPLRDEAKIPETEQAGSETGSDFGMNEGMDGGVEGGTPGGVLGGVLGGVVGGTGDITQNYDAAPRLVAAVKPVYPADAFTKKIEGVVEVEILIDAAGRVVRVRIIRSVPELDAAAVHAVRQWVFAPAMKKGHPVATVARAPIAFRIY